MFTRASASPSFSHSALMRNVDRARRNTARSLVVTMLKRVSRSSDLKRLILDDETVVTILAEFDGANNSSAVRKDPVGCVLVAAGLLSVEESELEAPAARMPASAAELAPGTTGDGRSEWPGEVLSDAPDARALLCPDSPGYAPESPVYVPSSPGYAPGSPVFVPESPAFVDESPAFSHIESAFSSAALYVPLGHDSPASPCRGLDVLGIDRMCVRCIDWSAMDCDARAAV